MNKALWAIIAAAALGATKKAASKGKIGSFNDLSDQDVFDLVGRLNNIRSFEDFMSMSQDERNMLRIQAAFLMNESSSNPQSPLAEKEVITVQDIQGAMRNKAFRKNIQAPALRKANRHIAALEQQRSFKQFSKTSPTRQKIQRKRTKPQLIADSVLSPIGSSRKGIIDSLFHSKDYTLNPEAFVSYIRLMCGSWYQEYSIFPDVHDGYVNLNRAIQDSYQYDALTDSYGPVTTSWAKSSLDKMVYFKEMADSISISPKFPINEQAIRFAYLNFYEFYVDQELFETLIQRWKESGGQLNSIIMKELHLLVFGVMYKISQDYLESELFSFLFFSDLSGQTILPFGNCSLSSYKKLLEDRSKGIYSDAYRYNIIRSEDDFSYVYFDGLGSLFDRLLHKSWSYTLDKSLTNNDFRDNIANSGDLSLYFDIQKVGEQLEFGYVGSSEKLTFLNEFNYKINGSFPSDQFSQFILWFKSKDFRQVLANDNDTLSYFVEKSALYGMFGLGSIYGEEDPMAVMLDNFFEIKDKLLRLGNWASECCIQMTKVVNSGQIDLALYLLSPIIDFDMVDTAVGKYNLPLSLYPSMIKKKLTKQQKEAIKQKYVSPQKSYYKGSERMKPLRRLFGKIISEINRIGVIGNTLSDELDLPMNLLLWKYMMIPDRNMDFAKPRKISSQKMVKKLRFRQEFGINYRGIPVNGSFIPYYIYQSDDDKSVTKQLKQKSSKAAAAAKQISSHAIENGILSFNQNGQPIWTDERLKSEYESLKAEEYISMADNQTYERILAAGKPLLTQEDFDREENYKKFHKDGFVRTLDKMAKEVSRVYSVDTATVSNSPFNRVVGLFFGGEPSALKGQDLINYYTKVSDQTKAIPTQSLSYSGIDMVPSIRGLEDSDFGQLERSVSAQRARLGRAIADGQAREGSLESLIIGFIEKAIKKQSVFGVPYISKQDMMSLTGIDFTQYEGSSEKVHFISRDGQVENLNGYFPSSNVNMVDVPADVWSRRYEKGFPIKNYIDIVYRAQSVFMGSLLQELFSRFSSKTSNYGDIGAMENRELKFYTKVKKIGSQLAVLGDDPLGFREMYRNLAKHSTSLEIKKQVGVSVIFDPNVIKNKELAKNSSYSEQEISKARKIIKIPSIQQLINDHFVMEKSGTFEIINSPQPLQTAILNILGVFAILDERIPSSRSEITAQQKKEFYQEYDLYLEKVLAEIDRLTVLAKIYDIVANSYGTGYLPVAEYEQMSLDDLNRLVSRYKKFGPYRKFYGVEEDFPQTFLDLVNRQQQAYKQFKTGVRSQTYDKFTPQYQSFDARFKDAFQKSFVEKQSQKIGALVGILPVGEGYRVYLPYTFEHIKNVARAGNRTGKNKKIVDLKDNMPHSFSSSVYCIADTTQRANYIIPWEKGNIMHLVVVSPDGNLHSLMTFDMNQGAPSEIQQWRANVKPPNKPGQPRIMDIDRYQNLMGILENGESMSDSKVRETREYYLKNFGMEPKEVFEVDSKIVREFGKLMQGWLQAPKTFFGDKIPNTTVQGASYSWTDRAEANAWSRNSKILAGINSRGNTEDQIMDSIDIGVVDNDKDTKGGYYNNININKTVGDIDVVRKYYESRLSKNSDLINEAREARVDKLKRQRKL